MLDTFGLTRQSYIGKEKEPENNLGDHTSTKLSDLTVRKYDYETGRFNSIDPLFEKYYGWSPYQYSMNNPIWAKDWNGEIIETIADVGFIAYDLWDIGVTLYNGDKVTATQMTALGADILGAAVPFATGGGMAVRAAAKVDDAVDVVKAVDRIIDTKKATQKGEFRKLDKKELKNIFGDDFHSERGLKEALKDDSEIKKYLKKTGDENFDFYLDKDSKEVLLRGNKSGKYIKSDIFIDK